jgi:hypothetical protein
LSRMSAAGGEADVFRQKADSGTRMSAVRGKADVPATWPGSPLLARCGHPMRRFSTTSATTRQDLNSVRQINVLRFSHRYRYHLRYFG